MVAFAFLTRVYAAFGRWTLAVNLSSLRPKDTGCDSLSDRQPIFSFRCLDLFLYLHLYEDNAKRDNRLRNDGLYARVPIPASPALTIITYAETDSYVTSVDADLHLMHI